MPRQGERVARPELPELDADMTRNDLIDVLRHLEFKPKGPPPAIRIDQQVRDFIIDALARR